MWDVPGSVESYQRPLMTVPEGQFDEYLSVLESKLEERLDEVPESSIFMYEDFDYGLASHHHRADPWAMDRNIYHELLENLEDVETRQDLFSYSEEIVETPGPRLPAPLDILERAMASFAEADRARVVEDVFDEAKRELAEQAISQSNP